MVLQYRVALLQRNQKPKLGGFSSSRQHQIGHEQSTPTEYGLLYIAIPSFTTAAPSLRSLPSPPLRLCPDLRFAVPPPHRLCLNITASVSRFHPGVDACFVPSEQLATLARKCGLAPNQVWLHGLPLCPGFWRELSTKPELQNELGLKPGVKACLVMGGRGGGERLEDIVDSVVHRLGQEMKESQVGRRGRARGRREAGKRINAYIGRV